MKLFSFKNCEIWNNFKYVIFEKCNWLISIEVYCLSIFVITKFIYYFILFIVSYIYIPFYIPFYIHKIRQITFIGIYGFIIIIVIISNEIVQLFYVGRRVLVVWMDVQPRSRFLRNTNAQRRRYFLFFICRWWWNFIVILSDIVLIFFCFLLFSLWE